MTANFASALAAFRRVGTHGGSLTHEEMRNANACILAAGTSSALLATSDTAVQSFVTLDLQTGLDATAAAGLSTTQAAAMVTQWALIDAAVADGGVDKAALAAVVATAKTALYTPMATLDTAVQLTNADSILSVTQGGVASAASTAALAAVPVASTLTPNPPIDGYDT